MAYRLAADLVVVAHFAFIVFVAIGALLAWRWPRLLWAHLPAVAYAAAIAAFGFTCPLTPLEKWFRERAGDGYEGGFVDRYIEGVIYPGNLTTLLRSLAAAAIVIGYLGLARRRFTAVD